MLGFINAVAITVFIEQMAPFFGLAKFNLTEDWLMVPEIIAGMDHANWLTAALGIRFPSLVLLF